MTTFNEAHLEAQVAEQVSALVSACDRMVDACANGTPAVELVNEWRAAHRAVAHQSYRREIAGGDHVGIWMDALNADRRVQKVAQLYEQTLQQRR